MAMQIIHIGKNEPRIETEGARLHPEQARQMRMTVITCCEFPCHRWRSFPWIVAAGDELRNRLPVTNSS